MSKQAPVAEAPVTGVAGITTDDQTNATERRAKGEFVRGISTARNWIQPGDGPYPPEKDRYHLYVAYNCPWCHRVLLGRLIMGLEDVITVDVVFPNRSSDDEPLGPNLWKFCPEGQVGINGKHVSFPSCTKDTVNGKTYIKEIYELAGIDDQKSLPILFDKQTNTVVSNESAEILRMFGTSMRSFASQSDVDLYPHNLAATIDELNDWIYTDIANGSYKAGFSSNQDVYETAYETFFDALDRLDALLADKTFLTGDSVTEADLRLFPAMFRFDPVYHSRFKLNKHLLWEYRNIWQWMQAMMALPGMEPVSNAEYLDHCKQGYFGRTGNGTVPVGPLGYPECYKEPHWTHQSDNTSTSK
jgi:putative glutathione S-transferase